MRALTLALALGLALPSAGLRAAQDVTIEATRRDDALHVVCRATLAAPAALIWETLTDYGHLAEFIPGMRRSHVLSRNGAVSIVEQSGEARFLFFSVPIEVTIASTERPPDLIEAKLLKGTLKRMDGAYRIAPRAGGGALLSWTGVVEADAMPPLFGELVMRANIEDQFRGMVREIERRDAQRREPDGRK
jgi:polyketide cyclase/dehydrase/lipid transport protein